MATYTSNLNLKKPALDDDALITDINNNMDILDAAANGIEDALAIVANGNTHAAITSGQFVYVRNHNTLTEGLYVASSNIAANATLSSSNLAADSKGGLNALSEQMANLIHKTNFKPTTDNDGDAFLTGLNLDTGVVVGIYPIRNGVDGTFNATWFLALGGDTNGTAFGFKAYRDNGTVLANQKVNVDVYWIPKAYLSSN